MHRRSSSSVVVLASLSVALSPLVAERARACGGGFTQDDVEVGMDTQLALYALRGDTTDLVVLVNVPEAASDFGVLVPVPAGTTISATPVSAAGLAALEEATRPFVTVTEESGGGGGGFIFACGGGGNGDGDGDSLGGVRASDPVDIGPVTAVVLTGESGAAVTDWLTENGFAVPEGAQSILDSHVNAGAHFVAMKRNETATGEAASLGVQMTIPGDHRGFALRMASIGAASELAITILVAAVDEAIGPSAPFAVLGLEDLDRATVVDEGYRAAVRKAVDANESRAFVAETSEAFDSFEQFELSHVLDDGMTITRLTTVMAGVDIGEDVALDATITVGDGELYIDRESLDASASFLVLMKKHTRDVSALLPFLLLVFALAVRAWRRARMSNPASIVRASSTRVVHRRRRAVHVWRVTQRRRVVRARRARRMTDRARAHRRR